MTVPVTADVLLRGQLRFLRESGFDVTVISSPGPELERVATREGVDVVEVPMSREVDVRGDAVSLRRMVSVLRRLRPSIVNASTAKAGLVGMLAAAATGVPVRIYQLRGLRLETETGLKRTVLAASERIAARCAHRIICNSESLRSAFVAARYAPAQRCVVLGEGSSNGVDTERFARDHWVTEAQTIRASLGIPPDARVIGFVGRPVADKGVVELLGAFERVVERRPHTHLLIVGAGFAGDHLPPAIATRMNHDRIHVVPRVAEPAPYYVAMDVLAFPSHREGFPNAPLEAAAASTPTVGARATGVRDAIVDGATGMLVDIGDVEQLSRALLRYVEDRALCTRHGEAARERAERSFAREVVWTRWRDEYRRLLRERT